MAEIGNLLTLLTLCILLMLSCLSNCSEMLKRSKRSETMGVGCEALAASLAHRPIPRTYLETGVFYQIKLTNFESSSKEAKQEGYITWDGGDSDSNEENENIMYVLADFQNVEMYEKGANWYKDSHWTFLASEVPDWYHFVNCGYPYKYATWRKQKALTKKEHNSVEDRKEEYYEFVLILDPYYPGNHSKEDFLFKPVTHFGDGQNEGPTYQLLIKSDNVSIVYYKESENSVEEGETEADKSEYLKVQASKTFTKDSSGNFSLFTFVSTEEDEPNKASSKVVLANTNEFQGQVEMCSYKNVNLVFTLVLVVWAVGMTTISIVQARKLHS